jgi:hypothetical protein
VQIHDGEGGTGAHIVNNIDRALSHLSELLPVGGDLRPIEAPKQRVHRLELRAGKLDPPVFGC